MANVLLIDDDTDVLEINRKFLTGEGFAVHTADTPLKGISLAKTVNPACTFVNTAVCVQAASAYHTLSTV